MKRICFTALAVFILVPAGARADAAPIVVCGHVSVTGAAPIPHAKARFGQFYFDDLNARGGIGGRPVRFDVFDDGSYPAGARAAMGNCANENADLYIGASGRDQEVSIAKWAEQKGVPYLHAGGPASDLSGMTWSASLGESDESQETKLADALIDNNTALGMVRPVFGMIRFNSPYYRAAHDAFAAELNARGYSLAVDEVVQKDENNFQNILVDMQIAGVTVINAEVSTNAMLVMLQQRPPSFNPVFTGIAPDWGWNIAASVIRNTSSRAVVLQAPQPACQCTYFNTDLDTTTPWYAEEQRFLETFRRYSPEQDPPPDDFDWDAYLRAKQIERFLRAANGDYSSDHLRSMFSTYSESASDAFPGCALDFSTTPGFGGHAENVYQSSGGNWKQVGTCDATSSEIDLTPPSISCGPDVVLTSGTLTCEAHDAGSGVGSWIASAASPLGSKQSSGDGACAHDVTLSVAVPVGVSTVQVFATDCAGLQSSARSVAAST